MTKTINAYAKINLALDVTNKLANGYHQISSVMQTITLHDTITISVQPSSTAEINLICDNSDSCPTIPWDNRNIVYKAAVELLGRTPSLLSNAGSFQSYKIDIIVHKVIPSGAGMAGGSTDAAATIILLNELLPLRLPLIELLKIGACLGADVPFCLKGGTQLCEGIGEILTALPAPKKAYIVLLKPEISLNTKEMYEKIDALEGDINHPNVELTVNALKNGSQKDLFNSLGNLFEIPAIALDKDIKTLKTLLMKEGAEASLMTGSGSVVFGLFSEESTANKAYESLKENDFIKSAKVQAFLSEFHN